MSVITQILVFRAMISILDFFADFLFITSTAVVFSASAEKTFQFHSQHFLKDYRTKKLSTKVLTIYSFKNIRSMRKKWCWVYDFKVKCLLFPFFISHHLHSETFYTIRRDVLYNSHNFMETKNALKLKIFVLKCCSKTKSIR